jgi:hypothetical protein
MNMFSHEDDSYESDSDNYSVYSDTGLDELELLGDRYADEPPQTEADKIEDAQETADEERKYRESLIQHPDEMEFILPTRVMPSVKVMNTCFQVILDMEQRAEAAVWAVPIIENWWCRCLDIKAARYVKQRALARSKELAVWKKARYGSRGISQLGPLIPFEVAYKQMAAMKRSHKIIKDGIEERAYLIKVRSNARKAAERATIKNRKSGKARALAKTGMNKKTQWHKDRAAGSIATRDMRQNVGGSMEGQGKRAQRKIRQEKDRIEAAAYSVRVNQNTEPVVYEFEETDDERTDEQKEADEEELTEALANMKRLCVEKVEQLEAREKAEAEEKAISIAVAEKEKKELDEFVTVMTKNKKTKKIVIELGFKSLREQTVERRKSTDKKFAARCNGFEDLGSKEKLADVLKFTTLCKSVTQKKKCYHKNCRFAHSVEQLVEKQCRFGMGCKFVTQMENGQYQNQKFGRTGKTCSCVHIGEHKRGFCRRMGLEYTPPADEEVCTIKPVVTVSPVHKTHPKPVIVSSENSAWSKVVHKAEIKEKVNEAKAKMTKAWSTVVADTLTHEQKLEIYGKGAEIVGMVTEERDYTPIIPTTIRKPWDKRGLGYSEPTQKICTKVMQTGFNWVRGAVLKPPPVEKKQCWDVVDPVMTKVIAAVEAINKRVADIQQSDLNRQVLQAKAKISEINKRLTTTDQSDLNRRVKLAKEKAAEINKKLTTIDQSNLNRRVRRAKAKAVEINKRLVAIERKSWTKVEGHKAAYKEKKETETTVIRVRKVDAELALLGAIRNGLTNFRIEYTDKDKRPVCSRTTRARKRRSSKHEIE